MTKVEVVGVNWSSIVMDEAVKPDILSVAVKVTNEEYNIIKDMQYMKFGDNSKWWMKPDLFQYDWVTELEGIATKHEDDILNHPLVLEAMEKEIEPDEDLEYIVRLPLEQV